MRRRLLWVILAVLLTVIVAGAAMASSMPAVRHLVIGWLNVPDRLPALAGNTQVHYEAGAEDSARAVAALLPQAIADVEAAHGRPFARPATIGVYATPDAYATANGLGSTGPIGVTIFGRVNLSPKLFGPQRPRLRAILTHELSHAHIAGWIGSIPYVRLPNWFKEGLAVMVSGGGGAEGVSEEEARAAIRRGDQIAVVDLGSVQSLGDLRVERVSIDKPAWYPVTLAYREAGMFVTYLRGSDTPAFGRTMKAILDGDSFADAMTAGYHDDARSLWQKFIAAQ